MTLTRGLRACITSAILAAAAQAQTPGPDHADPDRPTFYADFGFGGKIPAERWSPITVWVQAGEKALGGVIVAEFAQDVTQTARIVAPFAATPRVRTPVQIVAALPERVEEVTLTMYDDRGRRLSRLPYAANPRPDAARLPPMLSPGEGLLVSVGRTSLPEAVRAWTGASAEDDPPSSSGTAPDDARRSLEVDTDRAWSMVQAAAVEPDVLPHSWMAYDGVTALVVDAGAASRADPRALDAVHEWVRSGGRLAILAGAAGSAWREWLPPGAEGDLVEVGDSAIGPVPGECAAAIAREATMDARRVLPGGAPDEDRPRVLPAAGSIVHRPIRVTPGAALDGWRTRWAVGENEWGALAEGPVGFGWVTVLGLEPAATPKALSARTAGAVWRDALRDTAGGWFQAWGSPASNAWRGWPASPEPQQAVIELLSRLAAVPAVGAAVFLVIAACMVVLAVLVGPVDFFALRRLKMGQRSWMTALGWIALASAAAYLLPAAIRAGPTQVSRLTILDRIVEPPDRGVDRARAWQTGLTAVFAARSGEARFQRPDLASWWRGVSAVWDFIPSRGRTIGSVATAQGVRGADSGRGNPLERISLGLWTFRTFMDYSRPAPAPRAAVDRDGSNWVVRVEGLPAGARVADAALRVGNRWHAPLAPLGASQSAERTWSASTADSGGSRATPEAWLRSERMAYAPYNATSPLRPGIAASLPGAIERGAVIDRRVATGRWAAIYLHLDGCPADATLDWPSDHRRTAVVRLLVPLDAGDRVEPTDVTPVGRMRSQRETTRRSGVSVTAAPPVGVGEPPDPDAGEDAGGMTVEPPP